MEKSAQVSNWNHFSGQDSDLTGACFLDSRNEIGFRARRFPEKCAYSTLWEKNSFASSSRIFHSANGSKTTHYFAPRSRFKRGSGVTTPSSKQNALEAKILRFTGNSHFFTRGGVHFDRPFSTFRNRFVLFRNGA